MNRILSRCLVALATVGLLLGTSRADENDIRKAVTFYASYDESLKADVGGGQLTPDTRINHPTEKGQYVVEKGVNEKVFTIAKTKGIAGGALDAVDVLEKNGRIFYPAKGNIAFKKDGWSGSMSMWCKTDPDKLIKAKFCDPVQITQKGANNGGLWFDFNDAKPRDLRHGAFPMTPEGQKNISEDDPKAPMVRVPGVGWKADDWHHVVLTFKNLDTGKPDAVTALYIDGKLIGEVKDRAIAMGWDIEKAGIYTSINYIGLIDEFALFDKALSAEEVTLLHKKPDLLSPLKKKAAPEKPPAPWGYSTGRAEVPVRCRHSREVSERLRQVARPPRRVHERTRDDVRAGAAGHFLDGHARRRTREQGSGIRRGTATRGHAHAAVLPREARGHGEAVPGVRGRDEVHHR